MNNNQEKIFADGIRFLNPGPKAPQWVKGKMSVKVDAFVAFLQTHVKNGWVNLDLKESKSGVLYFELNTWQKGDSSGSREVNAGRNNEGYNQPDPPVETKIDAEDTPF